MNYKGVKHTTYICKGCQKTFPFKGYGSQNIFCNIACNKEYKTKQAEIRFEEMYQDWLLGKPLEYKNTRALIRKFVIKRDGYKCAVCKITEYNGLPITLWCDHIDGDASNDGPSNFRLVCPNCDSQSPTFGAKNYGKGRKSRGLPQYG